jgi:cytochrome c biogenesis protein CcmG/thiol:disulfide interchange protein DsbE
MTKKMAITFLALALAWPAYGQVPGVGDVAPAFTLTTTDGSSLNSEEIRKKEPILLVFWATWCSVCRREIRDLKKIYAAYESAGIRFLAINIAVNDSTAKVRRFMKRYKVTYPVSFDEGSRVTSDFGIQGTPTTIVVDKKGIIRYRSAALPPDLDIYLERALD